MDTIAKVIEEMRALEADYTERALVREWADRLAALDGRRDPDPALLASMATCLNHGFGLDSVDRQESQLHDMRKLWDEVMGRGYYSPNNRGRYTSMLAAAPPKGAQE